MNKTKKINVADIYGKFGIFIILIGTILTREHKKALRELDVPVVILGQKFQGFSCVYNDDYNAAKELTKKMIHKGRKNIGFIGVTLKDEAAGRNRYHGYLDAFRECQISVNENAMLESDFTIEDGYRKAFELMDRFPDLDGIFCATDRIAIGVIQRLQELHKRIPQDIAVVGFGHSSLSKVVTPKLTTVHFYYKTSGMEAANLLTRMLANEETIIRDLKMGYEIIEQESC